MTRPAILVVESSCQVGRLLRAGLSPERYCILEARSADEASGNVRKHCPDLIVLDLHLYGSDGRLLCRTLRRSSNSPILVLHNREARLDREHLLEMGADSCMRTPFMLEQLLARIREFLHRSEHDDGESVFVSRDMTINFDLRHVTVRGRPVHLPPKLFDLLKFLISHRGKAVSGQLLSEVIWGLDSHAHCDNLRVLISQLRKLIEADPAHPQYILTEPKIGYRFQLPAEEASNLISHRAGHSSAR
jgi:two-component system KDP operon response regulator KdpE